MKTFSEYVGNQKIYEVAELMTRLGIDSKAFCESVLTHARWAARKGVPFKEAFQNEAFTEAWYNPLSWVKGGGGAEAAPTPTGAEQLADRGDKGAKTTWANTGRRLVGSAKGFGSGVAGIFNGKGFAGAMDTGRSLATLQGAIKDIQNLKANLSADKALSSELMQVDLGQGMMFSTALDMMWQFLTNKMQEFGNAQQGGKRRQTLTGVETSEPGTAAAPYQANKSGNGYIRTSGAAPASGGPANPLGTGGGMTGTA